MSPVAPTEADRVHPAEWGALGVIVAAGVALRAFTAGRAPMWFDEIYTTWAARGGFARVLETLAGDVHPPLHTLLVSAWVSLGGESTPWLRSLSILFGAATILVTFLLGRSIFGRRAGLVAAALLALHPVHVYFSQESRVYVLLWLELTTAWWLAWRWIDGGRARHGAGYVAVAALAVYTHYLAGLVLAFTAAGGLVLCFRAPGGRRRAVEWAGLHLAALVLFAPQIPTFLAQNGRLASGHWLGTPDARDLRDWVRHVSADAIYLVPVFSVLGALGFARPQDRRPAAFLVWSAAGPVLLAWWLGTRGLHVFAARYMYFAVPALLVVAAGGFEVLVRRLRRRPAPARVAAWALLAFVLALETRAVIVRGRLGEADSLAWASARIRAEALPGDVVYCADTHALLFLAHYEPQLTSRVLWFDRALPHYEGALVIPDSLRTGPEAFSAAKAPGGRWWGLRVRRGGSNGPLAAALFDSAAAGQSRRFGDATLWGPK